MTYLAVQKNGTEVMFSRKPYRENVEGNKWHWTDAEYKCKCLYRETTKIVLPKGSIKKLIGKNLEWEDEAVKLK